MIRKVLSLFAWAAGLGGAATYDVTADWSNSSNPNGVWSYLQGSTPLPFQSNFGMGTCANTASGIGGGWAPGIDSSGYCVPVFFKATGNAANTNDWLAGDVLIHSAGGPNTNSALGQAQLDWIAPAAGTISFNGAIWYAHSVVARSNDFFFTVGGTRYANGTVSSSNGSNRSNMTTFSNAGPIAVSAGTQVILLIQPSVGQTLGSLAGVKLTITETVTAPFNQTYYFSDLAVAGGFQTTLTYINYSPQAVTCVTNFYLDSGSPWSIPFSQGAMSSRTDILQPGQSIHDQTVANLAPPYVQGWAQATCTGPVQASLLFRYYQSGAAVGEASVNAETAPATTFVTFAQTATGVAYANPSPTQSATITFTVYSTAGTKLGSQIITLGPLGHGSANLGPLLGLQNFTGFVKITATIPIISLSLNFEAFPVFSSLPPGDLPSSTPYLP